MASLTEVAEYIEEVLRLDTSTLVKGYDPSNASSVGPSNQQAQVLANRTKWLKEKIDAISDKLGEGYVLSVNDQTGAITISIDTLGAAAAKHTHKTTDIETDDTQLFVSQEEKNTWNSKQDLLVSGQTIKTINNESLMGKGFITIDINSIGAAPKDHTHKPEDINTSNTQQFVTQSQIELWNNKQAKLKSGVNLATINDYDLLEETAIELTASDVNAEEVGVAKALLQDHIDEKDPHSQYMNSTRGDERYVEKSTSNQANGYLKLDSDGNIPSDLLQSAKTRYVIVDNEEERLKLPVSPSVTVCIQSDTGATYYLNANEDPSVAGNWKGGNASDKPTVISVFGRDGEVVAQANDYTADLITETDTRKFVTPDQTEAWGAKQDALVNGVNIKTINGERLVMDDAQTFADEGTSTDLSFTTVIPVFDRNARLALKGRNQLDVCLQINNRTLYFLPAGEDGGQNSDGSDNWTHMPSGIRYAEDEDSRLGIYATDALTVCFQKDVGALYFLEPSLDPSKRDWKRISGEEGRIVTVKDKAARLEVEQSDIITMCIQTDDNSLYYLEANTESTEENWHPIATGGGSSGIDDEALDKKLASYVKKDTGNQPGGYVKIDDDGNLPSTIKIGADNINLKTVADQDLIGEGNIDIPIGFVTYSEGDKTKALSVDDIKNWNSKLDATDLSNNLKDSLRTVCGESLVKADGISDDITADDLNLQETLVSQGNIKSINGASLLIVSEGTEDNIVIDANTLKVYTRTEADKKFVTLNDGKLPSDIKIDITQIDETDDLTFVHSDDRKKWDAKLDSSNLDDALTTHLKTINGKSLIIDPNDESTNVQLDYQSVGADKSGTAELLLAEHTAYTEKEGQNPHVQYLLITEGSKPGGYLKLDENGNIPAGMLQSVQPRYVVVENEEERLKIERSVKITICLQMDNGTSYYLNSNEDPSVAENWKGGGSTVTNKVISIYGRSGVVEAEDGDYTATQITETTDKTFVSNDERTSWNSKQEKLTSGSNIKTINSETLLDSGDISITPTSIGAAKKVHTHEPGDINLGDDLHFVTSDQVSAWDNKQSKLVSGESLATVFGKDLLTKTNIDITDADNLPEAVFGTLEEGENIKLTLDSGTGLVKIESSGSHVVPVIQEITEAEAGKDYLFVVENTSFDASFNTFKRDTIIKSKTFDIDYDGNGVVLDMNKLTGYDEYGGFPNGASAERKLTAVTGEIEALSTASLTYSGTSEETSAVRFATNGDLISYHPLYENNNPIDNFTPIMSHNTNGYEGYKVFKKELTGSQITNVPVYEYYMPEFRWGIDKGDVFVGLRRTKNWVISAYGFQKFTAVVTNNRVSSISSWKFQGRQEQDDPWVTLDTQVNFMLNFEGTTVEWNIFKLDKPVSYKSYRILFTNVKDPSNGPYPFLPRLRFYGNKGVVIKDAANKYLTMGDDGLITQFTPENKYDIYSRAFHAAGPLGLVHLKDRFPIKLCSMTNETVTIVPYKRVPRIAIHNVLPGYKAWNQLKDIVVTRLYTQIDNDGTRAAVTYDGKNYYIFDDEQWKQIGTYEATDESALALIKDGMTLDELDNVTPAQWNMLVKNQYSSLWLAYAKMAATATAPITPRTLSVEFNGQEGWRVVTKEETLVGVGDGFVVFTPIEAGDYKFCYAFY